MEIEIKFELTQKTKYKSGFKPIPEFIYLDIDYQKLFFDLAQNGILDYDYKNYLGKELVNLGDGQPVIQAVEIPYSNSSNQNRVYNVRARIQKGSGKIDRADTFGFFLDIDESKDTVIYGHRIYYSKEGNPKKNQNTLAIEINYFTFEDYDYFLKLFHHEMSTDSEALVLQEFKKLFSLAGYNRNKLDFIYQHAPQFVLAERTISERLSDISILLLGYVDNLGSDEEEAVINLFMSFLRLNKTTKNAITLKHTQEDEKANATLAELKNNVKLLLDELLKVQKNIFGGQETLLQLIYGKMNDAFGVDNFTRIMNIIYNFWYFAGYAQNDYLAYTDSDVVVYDNRKILGFYGDSWTFKFEKSDIGAYKTDYPKSHRYKQFLFGDSMPVETKVATLHAYQPINIPEKIESGDLELPDSVIPAFYLKAIDDKNMWSNFDKAVWLSLDVITTFTGVDNILKLRYLLKLRHLKYFVKGFEGIKIVLGTIEFTSGVIGIMLDLTNKCDEGSFCRKLKSILIYIDLLTLGVDVVTSLRKVAREAVDEMPLMLRKQHPELFKELDNISDAADFMTRQERTRIIKEVEENYQLLFQGLKKGNYSRAENYSLLKTDEFFDSNKWLINGREGQFSKVDVHNILGLDTPTQHGIDGIYKFSNPGEPPPPFKYYVCEVKHTKEKPNVNKTITASGDYQMTEVWIKWNLRKQVHNSELRLDVLLSYGTLLVHVNQAKKGFRVDVYNLFDNASWKDNWTGIIMT